MGHGLLCQCRVNQTNIVEVCPSTKFEKVLTKLHEGEPAAVKWLEELTSMISIVIILIITTIFFFLFIFHHLFI